MVLKIKNIECLKISGLINYLFIFEFKCRFLFSFETLEEFARKVAAGDLEPYLKSQPVPEQTDDVKVVVAKNFDEIVNDNTKDVLIEFYAPW